MPNIEIKYPESVGIDDSGYTLTLDFIAGCVCNCWKDSFVEVIVPKGYKATTPTRQYLTGDDLLYTFGFVKEGQ